MKDQEFSTQQLKREGHRTSPTHQISPSEEEWQRQKAMENASNEAIDAIMQMTGLEDVKSQILRIKTKIDTTTRQYSDIKDERFNIAFLGNPGTGMILAMKCVVLLELISSMLQVKPPLPASTLNFWPLLRSYREVRLLKQRAPALPTVASPWSLSTLRRSRTLVEVLYSWMRRIS